ncbi:MAG: cation transporter [Firmicutes bacterium]|jgi:copper chaperone CopZ|nr:cation transporter [Bacillota bacterium]
MKKTYILDGLDCAHCAAEIENNVSKLEGVDSVSVSFLTTKMIVETAEEPTADMVKKLKKTVKKTDPDVEMKEA